jgi:hypothetical protein
MKKMLFVLLALSSLVAKAQKKKVLNPDTLDFARINTSMTERKIDFQSNKISFLAISQDSLRNIAVNNYPANLVRLKTYNALSSELDFMDAFLSRLLTIKSDETFEFEGAMFDYNTAVQQLKKAYTAIDFGGYESVYAFFSNWHDGKIQERQNAERIAVEKAREAARYKDSVSSALDTKIEKDRISRDSVALAKQRLKDSMDLVRYRIDKLNFEKECIQKFGNIKGKTISNGQVQLGFTAEMCEYAWGSDYSSFVTSTKDGSIETRIYRSNKILTLKNGILRAVTE